MLSRGIISNFSYFSYPDFQDLQARGRLLSGLTASFPMESDLEVDGVSEFVDVGETRNTSRCWQETHGCQETSQDVIRNASSDDDAAKMQPVVRVVNVCAFAARSAAKLA